MNSKVERKQTSIRMSAQGKRLIEQTANKLGVTQSAAVEMAIRSFAESHGFKVQNEDASQEGKQ